MELHPAVQKYAWGKVGNSSLVAKFAAASSEGSGPAGEEAFIINPKETYAELWMGCVNYLAYLFITSFIVFQNYNIKSFITHIGHTQMVQPKLRRLKNSF
jgi:mannose-6-phosphate isomerase class I